MSRVGIQAVSLDKESVKRLKDEGSDVFRRVRECEWSMVIASPERLTAPHFDAVVRNDNFRKNIMLYVIDEVHVLRPWSLTFRKCYDDVPEIRLRLPIRVPLLALTATLLPGSTESNLIETLRFRQGFSVTRRSSERLNRRIVMCTLSQGLDGTQFPDLAWFAAGKFKFILYCKSIDLAYRVASFLWRLLPPGPSRRRKIRLYNALISPEENAATVKRIDEDPELMGVVATIKLGMGIDVRRVIVVGVVGLTDSVETDEQEGGRAVRDPLLNGASITYVEKSVVATIAKELKSGKVSGSMSDSEVEIEQGSRVSHIRRDQNTRRTCDDLQIAMTSRHAGKNRRLIDVGNRQLVTAHIQRRCLVVERNKIFGNVHGSSTHSCFEAKRPLPCSSCLTHKPFASLLTKAPFSMSTQQEPDTTEHIKTEEVELDFIPLTIRLPLTKAMQTTASTSLDSFARDRWLYKHGLRFRHVPHTAYIPSKMRQELMAQFHTIRDREALAGILADWEFLDHDLNPLYDWIKTLNNQFDNEHAEARAARNAKSRETRRRKAGESNAQPKRAVLGQQLNRARETQDLVQPR